MSTEAEMPRYKSHKEVRALKIRHVEYDKAPEGQDRSAWLRLTFVEPQYAPIKIPPEMFARYEPVVGDYYVVYEDGYRSISPAKAFEEGYTRVEKETGSTQT